MAWTGDTSTGAFFNTGIGIARIWGGIEYDWSRTNNTVTFTNTRARIRYVRESGSWGSFTYGPGWTWRLHVSGQRSQNSTSGTRSVDNTDWGSTTSFSISVGANDTSTTGYVSAWFAGDPETWTGGLGLSFGALGSPAGTTYFSSRTDTSLSVRNDVTSWGAYATAGSVRSYRADNSGFSGQTYLGTTDNAVIAHTGLTPNKEYWFRGWASNGGGKTAYMTTTTAVTLANSTITSTNIESVAAQFVGTATTGKYTPSTKIQYREVGAGTWEDSSSQSGGSFDIEVTGLSPSLSYEYRLATTTTAGTWYGATTPFETLPAAKLVMPDGTVKSAVPYLIDGEGNAEMVKVKVL